jgi:uncharacterized protein
MLPEERLNIWVLTDGKAGDEMPCLGVAEALSSHVNVLRIAPRALYAAMIPWGIPLAPLDPHDIAMLKAELGEGRPDILIASGRRAIAYVRWLKAQSPSTYAVILKDPRTRFSGADLIWVQEHDRLRGTHVITTLTSPHRQSQARLKEARKHRDPRMATINTPRIAVLLGGNSRHHHFSQIDETQFMAGLQNFADQGVGLMISPSRRTPPELADKVRELCEKTGGFFWNGTGENPYTALLALADALIVTADSTNMVGEAACTGKPVYVFEPTGGHRKISAFLKRMQERGYTLPFTPHIDINALLKGKCPPPLDATPLIASMTKECFLQRAR